MLEVSILAILVANGVTAYFAAQQAWPVQMLLWTFWIQSVVIGVFSYIRIMSLRRFRTDGVTWNDKPLEPTEATKHSIAGFFAMHYGLFHVVGLVFLVVLGHQGKLGRGLNSNELMTVWGLGALFALTHALSRRVNFETDLRHEQNIGALMFLPYARILPMQVPVIVATYPGLGPLWLFMALKTIADVVAHIVEHLWLRSGRLKTFRLDIGTED
ncbi:MAG TPA: DUF6498-containing protein [Xanthomonadales bacterium]|nr:DUF6498-containing protein [Xanthomonadales bacterium]